MNPVVTPRFRRQKSPSHNHFLGVFPQKPPENPNAAISATADDDLNEHDVFWTGDYSQSSHHHSNPPLPGSVNRPNQYPNGFGPFAGTEKFGILTALHENGTRPVLHHKASVSSSSLSSSSSRMIPPIPKPPRSSVKYPQSAPVDIPIFPEYMQRNYKFEADNDDIDGDEEEAGEMIPPHEIAARMSPLVACSVVEGVGRTLKGRDLHQVRNAVWRRTGFLD